MAIMRSADSLKINMLFPSSTMVQLERFLVCWEIYQLRDFLNISNVKGLISGPRAFFIIMLDQQSCP